MTGTDYGLFTHKSVPVIFEPPCIKSVLWRAAKCLSYIEEARCLKVKLHKYFHALCNYFIVSYLFPQNSYQLHIQLPKRTVGLHFSMTVPNTSLRQYLRYNIKKQTNKQAHACVGLKKTRKQPAAGTNADRRSTTKTVLIC